MKRIVDDRHISMNNYSLKLWPIFNKLDSGEVVTQLRLPILTREFVVSPKYQLEKSGWK